MIFPANPEHVIKPPAIDLSGRLYVITAHILLSDEKKQTDTVSRKELEADAAKQYPSFRLLTKANTSPRERVDIKQFNLSLGILQLLMVTTLSSLMIFFQQKNLMLLRKQS